MARHRRTAGGDKRGVEVTGGRLTHDARAVLLRDASNDCVVADHVRAAAWRPRGENLEQPVQETDDERFALLRIERLAEARLAFCETADGHDYMQAGQVA